MQAQNTTAVGFGVALTALGLVLGWGGLAPLTEDRDADGYYMSNEFAVDQESHAVVTSDTGFLRGRFHTIEEESLIVAALLSEPDEVRMRSIASMPDVPMAQTERPSSLFDERPRERETKR